MGHDSTHTTDNNVSPTTSSQRLSRCRRPRTSTANSSHGRSTTPRSTTTRRVDRKRHSGARLRLLRRSRDQEQHPGRDLQVRHYKGSIVESNNDHWNYPDPPSSSSMAQRKAPSVPPPRSPTPPSSMQRAISTFSPRAPTSTPAISSQPTSVGLPTQLRLEQRVGPKLRRHRARVRGQMVQAVTPPPETATSLWRERRGRSARGGTARVTCVHRPSTNAALRPLVVTARTDQRPLRTLAENRSRSTTIRSCTTTLEDRRDGEVVRA